MESLHHVRFHPDTLGGLSPSVSASSVQHATEWHDDDPTEFKLAVLESLHPDLGQEALMDALLTVDGSVQEALVLLGPPRQPPRPVQQQPTAAASTESHRMASPDLFVPEVRLPQPDAMDLCEDVASGPAANSEARAQPSHVEAGDEHSVFSPQNTTNELPNSEQDSTSANQRGAPSALPLTKPTSARYQASIAKFFNATGPPKTPTKPATRRGHTLHLYSPESIAANTPCSLVPNFLPPALADDLLRELLAEVPSFRRDEFKLFDRVVSSPHTSAFYVDPAATKGTAYEGADPGDFFYNGAALPAVRTATPFMQRASSLVEDRVNAEIAAWTAARGGKLLYQSPGRWRPNTAFVNCYDGGSESVGYHADQMTYLGPRSVIGSVSLGVEREFRVRRVVPAGEANAADTQGQVSIHLPHNSLLVMHADMQETHKHAVAAAQTIAPHPIAGAKRLNITYRHYRDAMHPRHTPRCSCGVQAVLRCSMRGQGSNRGRYMWMCHTSYSAGGGQGCGFFEWAVFDCDGEPPWAPGFKGPAEK